MKFQFRSVHILVPDGLESNTEHKFRRALQRAGNSVRELLLTVMDTNGPKGGIDKLCRANVVLTGSRRLVLEERGDNLYAALARLAKRTARSVTRTIKNRRSRKSIRLLLPMES